MHNPRRHRKLNRRGLSERPNTDISAFRYTPQMADKLHKDAVRKAIKPVKRIPKTGQLTCRNTAKMVVTSSAHNPANPASTRLGWNLLPKTGQKGGASQLRYAYEGGACRQSLKLRFGVAGNGALWSRTASSRFVAIKTGRVTFVTWRTGVTSRLLQA